MPIGFDAPAKYTKSDYFVIEADEYDTSFFDKRSKFMHYRPWIFVINNIEFDHADIFKDITDIHKEFHNLIRSMPEEAQIIFPTEDLNIAKVLNMGCWSKQESYSVNGKAQNNYTAISSDYSKIRFKTDTDEGELNWKMFGEYNARNAMSAILAARRYGVTLTQSLEALSNFKGVAKRQDILIEEETLLSWRTLLIIPQPFR